MQMALIPVGINPLEPQVTLQSILCDGLSSVLQNLEPCTPTSKRLSTDDDRPYGVVHRPRGRPARSLSRTPSHFTINLAR